MCGTPASRSMGCLDLVQFAKKLKMINSTIFVLFGKYCLIVD
jgi:hypothetical protein